MSALSGSNTATQLQSAPTSDAARLGIDSCMESVSSQAAGCMATSDAARLCCHSCMESVSGRAAAKQLGPFGQLDVSIVRFQYCHSAAARDDQQCCQAVL